MESDKLAEWLIIGFKRSWLMKDVYVAAGLSDEDATDVHAQHRFMPPNSFSMNRPVRAFFAVEWPRLSAHLCMHEGSAEKLLAVVPQLVRLVAKGQRLEVRAEKERGELRAAQKKDRAVEASYRLSRAAFRTHGADWNVCK